MRGVATAAQADDGGQARVVPAGHFVVIHQFRQFAFAGDDVGEVEPCKFVLMRGRGAQEAAFDQPGQQPVVKRALVFKLQRADAVGDLLQRVLYRVGKGVHRVDTPFAAGVVVVGAADAVDGGVAQVDVGRGHVDLGAQHHGAVGMLVVAHFAKDRQVLRRGAVAVRAVHAGVAKVAPAVAHFVRRLGVYIGVAGFDQVFGGAVHEVEVVAGLVQVDFYAAGVAVLPVKAEPFDGVFDGVDILGVFFFRVGVVKPQVAHAAVVARQAEVEADALGVADVQVAVGLGREAGADVGRVGLASGLVRRVARAAGPAAAGVGAGGEVMLDDLA